MHRALILLTAVLLAQGQVPAPVGGDMSNTTVKATSGTTARTLATRFPEVTAQDFNLTAGGGTADDTAAVQAAFNSGQPVFLIPGVYSVTCLIVPTGLSLRGAGPARTVIKQRTGSTCATLTGTSATDVSISGIQINANNTGVNVILSQTNGQRWRIFNNTIQGSTDTCIQFSSGTDTFVTGNTIANCAGNGHAIVWTGSASRFGATDNNISNVSGAGTIYFSTGIDGSIKGNTVSTTGGSCVSGYQSDNLRISISDNNCTGSLNHGIHVGGSYITIAGNNLYTFANEGIFIRATDNGGTTGNLMTSRYVTITGNNVHQSTGSGVNGIYVVNGDTGTVTGNTVNTLTRNGIELDLSTNFSISGNVIGPTTGGGIALTGTTNSIVSGNLVHDATGNGYRAQSDLTGTEVVSTGNTFTGNSSVRNGGDYIDATNATGNYYAFNNSAGSTSGTSPSIGTQPGSVWLGTANGSNDLQLMTPGGVQVRVKDTAAATNYVQLTGSATSPLISVGGASTTQNLTLAGKGSGAFTYAVSNAFAVNLATLLQGSVTMSGLPTTCTAQPSKSVANISGVLNLCP